MYHTLTHHGRQLLLAVDYQHRRPDLFRAMGQLCRDTWGFDFEAAHRLGLWDGSCHLYTLFDGGAAVAHITATELDFRLDGRLLRLVQLGTVMTRQDCRGQGLGRLVMQRVLADFAHKDAVYLFANASVTGYYPRFGFLPSAEYPRVLRPAALAQLQAAAGETPAAKKLPPPDDAAAHRLLELGSRGNGAGFAPVQNRFLTRFYLHAFPAFSTGELLWELPGQQAVAIAEEEDGRLVLHDLLGSAPLWQALAALVTRTTRQVELRLAFDAPWLERQRDPESRLFLRGPAAELLAGARVVFPTTTHT